MPHTAHTVALCCYKDRAVVLNRCELCKAEYGCPEFKTKAAVMKFNALIPPSMLLAPLPMELWPNMCRRVSSPTSSQSTESPVRQFVATLGLLTDLDADSK
jgi:hypothetical protein